MLIDREGAPIGSPGCFGRAMSFREGTAECDTCPFAQDCAPLSLARTAAIRAKHGIVEKEPKVKKAAGPTKPVAEAVLRAQAMGMSLPKKVVDLLGRFERTGIRVTESLAANRNPFDETPAFMRVACFILLRHRQNGVPKRFLVTAMMQRFKWPETTAVPHATVALQALAALGCITEADGIVRLSN